VKRLSLVVVSLALCTGLPALFAGCSGTGAPSGDPGVAELQTLVADQLSAAVLLRSWFSMLHVRQSVDGGAIDRLNATCSVEWDMLPEQPGDPPGTFRAKGTTSDCLHWEAVQWPDGSGKQTYTKDGQRSTMTWDAPRMQGPWQIVDIDQTMWDGARLVYESGYNLESTNSDQYYKGRATLADGREMHFEHYRNNDRDDLSLRLPDGSGLDIGVPLTTATGAPYWPIFTQGANGTFRGPSGLEQTLRLSGVGAERWDRWELHAPGGIEGRFTLNQDLSGSGDIRRGGKVVAALEWAAGGDGLLRPVGATAVEATASAAARAFQIDSWIGNIAAIGPMPYY